MHFFNERGSSSTIDLSTATARADQQKEEAFKLLSAFEGRNFFKKG